MIQHDHAAVEFLIFGEPIAEANSAVSFEGIDGDFFEQRDRLHGIVNFQIGRDFQYLLPIFQPGQDPFQLPFPRFAIRVFALDQSGFAIRDHFPDERGRGAEGVPDGVRIGGPGQHGPFDQEIEPAVGLPPAAPHDTRRPVSSSSARRNAFDGFGAGRTSPIRWR